jgi:3-hydroxybutyryl-CoA dehydrogenase
MSHQVIEQTSVADRPAVAPAESAAVAAQRILRVGVVGCGVMGAGLAEACARAGREVRVVASGEQGMARGRRRLERSLENGVRKGKITDSGRAAVMDRVSFVTELGYLADRQLVLEAAPEDEATKLEIFRTLDQVVQDPEAILASNTSSIPIAKLGRATERPGRVVGVHFFNPVSVLPLVEVISSLLTDERTGAGDRSGFVVNALLIPYLISAIRMFESGFAPAEDIDRGMTLGCSHPMGPLALADLIGLDIVAAVSQALYEEFKEPVHAVPPVLSRMVDSGLLGRKTGRGFYSYA